MLPREKSLRQSWSWCFLEAPLPEAESPFHPFLFTVLSVPFFLHLWKCSWAVSSLLNTAVWFYCDSDLHLFMCVLFSLSCFII